MHQQHRPDHKSKISVFFFLTLKNIQGTAYPCFVDCLFIPRVTPSTPYKHNFLLANKYTFFLAKTYTSSIHIKSNVKNTIIIKMKLHKSHTRRIHKDLQPTQCNILTEYAYCSTGIGKTLLRIYQSTCGSTQPSHKF